jgi:hypothetical protein
MTITYTRLSAAQAGQAAATLPLGFIALSESPMAWADAKAWCQQQGGRLPLINGAASLTGAQIENPRTAFIDGFGQINTGPNWPDDWTTPWPSGLPVSHYWPGTELTGKPGDSWIVRDHGGVVLTHGDQSSHSGSLCSLGLPLFIRGWAPSRIINWHNKKGKLS